ncbi:uncharacterized protein LOC107982116 [Nasonia vitripennis]|uniref:Uncharacterized protein n=1 Tax=Nasonia vitripennis TaxID=7425 RepID=A0A7M7Q916_NASVI|nr:uncharacterized protein LOC107982116 [Nasonia vitripennis]
MSNNDIDHMDDALINETLSQDVSLIERSIQISNCDEQSLEDTVNASAESESNNIFGQNDTDGTCKFVDGSTFTWDHSIFYPLLTSTPFNNPLVCIYYLSSTILSKNKLIENFFLENEETGNWINDEYYSSDDEIQEALKDKSKECDIDTDNKLELTICRVIRTKPFNYSTAIQEIVEFRDIICIQTIQILLPSVFVEAEGKRYIVPIPNLYSY